MNQNFHLLKEDQTILEKKFEVLEKRDLKQDVPILSAQDQVVVNQYLVEKGRYEAQLDEYNSANKCYFYLAGRCRNVNKRSCKQGQHIDRPTKPSNFDIHSIDIANILCQINKKFIPSNPSSALESGVKNG